MVQLRPLVLVAVLAALIAAPASSAATPAPSPGPGAFRLVWGPAKPADRPLARALRRSGAVEAVIGEVNGRYALPRDVRVEVSGAATWGPAYVPVSKREPVAYVFVPTSFLTLSRSWLAPELKGSGIGATEGMILNSQFVLAHELGHAIVDQLELPITGREEDAVDGFAAFLLVANPRFGPAAAVAAAAFFDAVGRKRGTLRDRHFADEHTLPQQRMYQFLCWIYGSDTKRYRGLVGRDLLPRSRAVRCRAEWKQVNRSWTTLLAPYARPAAAR